MRVAADTGSPGIAPCGAQRGPPAQVRWLWFVNSRLLELKRRDGAEGSAQGGCLLRRDGAEVPFCVWNRKPRNMLRAPTKYRIQHLKRRHILKKTWGFSLKESVYMGENIKDS